MPLLDTIQDGIARFMPKKSSSTPAMSGGIGSGGHVMVPFDDEVSTRCLLSYVFCSRVYSCTILSASLNFSSNQLT